MKKILLSFLIMAILGMGGVLWFYENIKPVSTNKSFANFVIAKGSSASQIGNSLQSKGFIRSALVFRIYLKITGQSAKLPTGEFRLSPSFTLFQTVDALFKGPLEIWVTIPEGLRREEIAQKFMIGMDRDQAFTNDFLQSSHGMEGTLFPDTYLFPKDASASAIVAVMIKNFRIKTADFKVDPGMTFNQRLILASILERETKTDIERPVVAGIMLNRLNAGMPLQVDATVQYAVGTSKNWWPILSLEDLKIKSPFNTYKVAGLPPSPISNPGLSSLNAAFNPVESDYFYYIHDNSSQIHYARTLEEHNANIRKYLGK